MNFTQIISGVCLTALISACGGGGDPATPSPAPPPTPTPKPEPAPSASPVTCVPHANGSTGYSLVFKGCDASNAPLYYDKTECVRSNRTGLIWQGQTSESTGLRSNDQQKTNFDSTIDFQNYNYGRPLPATLAQINDISNTIGFKNAVNAINLCGSSAWRLPTKDELLGIVEQNEIPKINNAWFPNTPSNSTYWTSTNFVGIGTPANAQWAAWHVNFYSGDAVNANRGNEITSNSVYPNFRHLVRLVRN